ncbi:MAG: hypothetical protein LC794_10100 [Acidobacteria bacterium]|nr:hypothetical protein [Acidobacteriota bacterium]
MIGKQAASVKHASLSHRSRAALPSLSRRTGGTAHDAGSSGANGPGNSPLAGNPCG